MGSGTRKRWKKIIKLMFICYFFLNCILCLCEYGAHCPWAGVKLRSRSINYHSITSMSINHLLLQLPGLRRFLAINNQPWRQWVFSRRRPRPRDVDYQQQKGEPSLKKLVFWWLFKGINTGWLMIRNVRLGLIWIPNMVARVQASWGVVQLVKICGGEECFCLAELA